MNGNENIYHVEIIDGLISEVNKHLGMIRATYAKERLAKDAVIEEVNAIQKGSLYTLRTLCEGD